MPDRHPEGLAQTNRWLFVVALDKCQPDTTNSKRLFMGRRSLWSTEPWHRFPYNAQPVIVKRLPSFAQILVTEFATLGGRSQKVLLDQIRMKIFFR
jgi:hypothetical protein